MECESVNNNKVKLMWRQRLDRSLTANAGSLTSTFFSLATMAGDGTLRNRTVVFRGFFGEPNKHVSSINEPLQHSSSKLKTIFENIMVFTTDIRMKKVQDLKLQKSNGNGIGFCEICCFLPGTNEQYRIKGILSCIPKNITPDLIFGSLLGSYQQRNNSSFSIFEEMLSAERSRHFKHISPSLRASFVWSVYNEKNEYPDIKELKESNNPLWDLADSRFCLLLLQATQVERLDLNPIPFERESWNLS